MNACYNIHWCQMRSQHEHTSIGVWCQMRSQHEHTSIGVWCQIRSQYEHMSIRVWCQIKNKVGTTKVILQVTALAIIVH